MERCNHKWIVKDNKMVCEKCGKSRLTLSKTEFEGLQVGITNTGTTYRVRDDRSRYFFPDEWVKFYDSLSDKNKPIFDVLINTGARIEEALNITWNDFTEDRKTLTLRVTKVKVVKGDRLGKKRTFNISTQFLRRMKRYKEEHNLKENDKMFTMSSRSVWWLLRSKLKKIGIKDWYNFSLHNIRKTHGMWLKALEVQMNEICSRLGHDYNTYQKHYGSPNVFERKDKLLILNILGDVYNLK